MGKKNINSILIFIFRVRYRSYITNVLWNYVSHFLIYLKEHLKNNIFIPYIISSFNLKKTMHDLPFKAFRH